MVFNFRRSVLFVSSALIFAAACNNGTSTLPDGVLLQDDFSNRRSGWMVLEDRDGFLRYVEGAYVVRINTPRIVLWGVSNSSQNFTDIRIEVAAHDKSEIFEVSFGVLCNYQDAENFYLFEIGPDGFYRIVRVSAGEQVVLAGEELSVDIAIGQETYQLEVECASGRQSLRVDGKEIAQVMDTTHTNGDLGLLAHSYARGGVEIYFDDLKVSSLE